MTLPPPPEFSTDFETKSSQAAGEAALTPFVHVEEAEDPDSSSSSIGDSPKDVRKSSAKTSRSMDNPRTLHAVDRDADYARCDIRAGYVVPVSWVLKQPNYTLAPLLQNLNKTSHPGTTDGPYSLARMCQFCCKKFPDTQRALDHLYAVHRVPVSFSGSQRNSFARKTI